MGAFGANPKCHLIKHENAYKKNMAPLLQALLGFQEFRICCFLTRIF